MLDQSRHVFVIVRAPLLRIGRGNDPGHRHDGQVIWSGPFEKSHRD